MNSLTKLQRRELLREAKGFDAMAANADKAGYGQTLVSYYSRAAKECRELAKSLSHGARKYERRP